MKLTLSLDLIRLGYVGKFIFGYFGNFTCIRVVQIRGEHIKLLCWVRDYRRFVNESRITLCVIVPL